MPCNPKDKRRRIVMLKIVAFDLDGTIADIIPMCIKAFRNGVSPYTDHELSEEEILHTFGLNEVGMVKAVVSQNWETAVENFYVQYESLHNDVILSILVDTFFSRISLSMPPIPKSHNTACVLS